MEPKQRMLAALSAEDGILRRAGLELIVDHVLAQPLSAWLDVDGVTGVLVDALSRDNAARVLERHIVPGLSRVHAALRAANERLGDALPADAQAAIDALVTHPRGPRFGWLRGALDRDKLRALLAPALQEMFVSFAARIPLAGRDGGAAGGAAASVAGLVGSLGRGAGERLRSLGKSVADGLGVDIEAKLRDAARDYSQGAVSGLERAVSARLSTPEGAALVAGLSRSVLQHVLATPLHVILDDLDRLPLADALRVAPPVVAHDLSRELWRAIVREETRAYLALEGQRSLRELLDEAGLLTSIRGLVLTTVEPVARELFASAAFEAWLERLLQA